MAQVRRLTALQVNRLREPGFYPDGAGLYLQVTRGAAGTVNKSWVYRYEMNGRERYMGLGPLATTSLTEARSKAIDARRQRADGVDPIDARGALRAATAAANAKSITFDQSSAAYIAAHRVGWRNAKHASQWPSSLAAYASPVFGKLPVSAIDVGLVMKALEPIWSTIPETASRVRQRIESILDWAKVRGYRTGENPARWRGHLDKLLPLLSKVRKVKHHAALPYAEIGAFIAALRARSGTTARALEFAILTAARTGEVLGARWDEIDTQAKTWTVPASRMKSGREHRVPLSDAALTVIEFMRQRRENDFVFPGNRRDTLSKMAFLMLLRQMARRDLTAHGFRATFKTWATERGRFPREVVEAALAHVIGNKVEEAYQRGDLFEKRRRLMDAWAEVSAKAMSTGEVVPLQQPSRKPDHDQLAAPLMRRAPGGGAYG
jgi:integrase